MRSILVLLLLNSVYTEQNVLDERIVDGEEADIQEFPYLVSLRSQNYRHFCGGTLISKQIIVTAGHCFTSDQITLTWIVYRTTKLNDKNPHLAYPEKILVHEDFEYDFPKKVSNDIALVKLKKPIDDLGGDFAQLRDDEVSIGMECWAAGWGTDDRSADQYSSPTNELKKVKLSRVEDDECKNQWKSMFQAGQNICMESKKRPLREGVCLGDSGGPLICDGKLGGVVSFGSVCATGQADVFAKIEHYKDWINSKKDSL